MLFNPTVVDDVRLFIFRHYERCYTTLGEDSVNVSDITKGRLSKLCVSASFSLVLRLYSSF